MMTGGGKEDFAAFALRARNRGTAERRLFGVLEATDRSLFVDSAHRSVAWGPSTIPLACGQALESADLQIDVLQALGIEADHRVLEIGTGSGFTAAVMAQMADRVRTVERYRSLVKTAKERFERLGRSNIIVSLGDGLDALSENDGPFDRVVVWCAFDEMPRQLLDWMTSGSIAVVAVGPADGVQELLKLTKIGSRFERDVIGSVRFQPLDRGSTRFL